ncbi:Melanoma inhibitory activity protein 3 [Microtus ochrogaster]|uniref:Melanoma inhibitory activity protein 3 n=1 Tax=Microtus ochrogaster TaxID=79684 RepID=A0A8J6GAY0_MICOH|nr:Melanoma inhibitory activity protein 3 [Microtus ochrogaster]
MYRAEALVDFTGPDCRFVSFKKGDHVHVYYRLAGGSPEVWAGSALTNCITQLNLLECELESEDQNEGGIESDELANGEVGGDRNEKIKNRIKRMMDVSWTQTAVSVVEEDLKLLQLKLKTSMSTKCNLEDQIKKLEDDHNSLQTTKAELEEECQTLRQKVEVRNELYQQWEIALQRKLSQEEYERQDREQRLSAADEKVALAAEEVKTYKRRIEKMEEELEKTERSFKNQIAAHEKKAHDNWVRGFSFLDFVHSLLHLNHNAFLFQQLKARAAERAISGEKREAAYLRHKYQHLALRKNDQRPSPIIPALAVKREKKLKEEEEEKEEEVKEEEEEKEEVEVEEAEEEKEEVEVEEEEEEEEQKEEEEEETLHCKYN